MKNSKQIAVVSVVSALFFIVFFLLRLFYSHPNQYALFEIMMVVGVLFPPMLFSIIVYRVMKSKEEHFPFFIDDISNNLQIGVSLFDTIELLTRNNYGALTKDVKKIHIQMTWGHTFSDSLKELCDKSHSTVIKKAGYELISTLNSGGELSKVLKGISTSMKEYHNVIKERKGQIYEQVLTGYMVFFIFLGIIFVVVNQLLPFVKVTPLGVPSASAEVYKQVLFHFSLIEAVCISLIIGQMGEGSITAGFKHILVLVTATVIVFSFL